ncbi:MAG: ImmA/IrrE family metallo-endopeptidase [Patescibacteria group bacterium]
MLVDINPKILIWAREEAGMSLKQGADKLKIDIEDLLGWENGEQLTFSSLEKIAHLYKRQTAIFFLESVPAKIKKPKSYRNLAVTGGNFSPEAMLAVRRTERYLATARDLSSPDYWNNQYVWLKNFTGKPENIEKEISMLRDYLEIEAGSSSVKKAEDLFRKLRNKFEEKLGIFVFQFPMPEKEFDGFSYAFEQFPYAIVVNNQSQPVKKIFTLFHELCHILKHKPGACKNNYIESENVPVELECNNFAGKFLVPTALLKATNSVDEIFSFASQFNISGEVYLRRLVEEKKITKPVFFKLLDLVREKSNSLPRKNKKQDGGPSMVIQSKSTRGKKFFETIANAAIGGKISYSTASDLLGLKVGNIRL